jgi:hypothetical protein
VWAVAIDDSKVDEVIYRLTVNKTGEVPYKAVEVQDSIWTLGLPDELLDLTPTIAPKLSPLSELTVVEKEITYIECWVEKTNNVFIDCIWGIVKKPVTELVKVTKTVVNFLVTMGEAISTGNLSKAVQALEDYGNFVWQGIMDEKIICIHTFITYFRRK